MDKTTIIRLIAVWLANHGHKLCIETSPNVELYISIKPHIYIWMLDQEHPDYAYSGTPIIVVERFPKYTSKKDPDDNAGIAQVTLCDPQLFEIIQKHITRLSTLNSRIQYRMYIYYNEFKYSDYGRLVNTVYELVSSPFIVAYWCCRLFTVYAYWRCWMREPKNEAAYRVSYFIQQTIQHSKRLP